jgi:hypothetical protein
LLLIEIADRVRLERFSGGDHEPVGKIYKCFGLVAASH